MPKVSTFVKKLSSDTNYLYLEFGQLAALVRDDLLGLTKSVPVKRLAKRFQVDIDTIELALEALQYYILHVTKMNAVANPNDFEAIYAQTGLNNSF